MFSSQTDDYHRSTSVTSARSSTMVQNMAYINTITS